MPPELLSAPNALVVMFCEYCEKRNMFEIAYENFATALRHGVVGYCFECEKTMNITGQQVAANAWHHRALGVA